MVEIRPLRPADKAQWLPLWQGYLDFYEHVLAPEVTENTWARLTGRLTGLPGQISGFGAFDENGGLKGFTHYLLHSGTWGDAEVCYLEDLFVCEDTRGLGIGRRLIQHLATHGRACGWQRIYWQTAESNKRAQLLYDKLANRTDWVRYEIEL